MLIFLVLSLLVGDGASPMTSKKWLLRVSHGYLLAGSSDCRINTKLLFGERTLTKHCMQIQITKILNKESSVINILGCVGHTVFVATT